MDAMRERLESERRIVMDQLQQIRGASELTAIETAGVEDAVDGGDRAQANLRQHIEVATYQRLVERLRRLNEALERIDDGTYGQCARCARSIASKRLAALPEAALCVSCQEAQEFAARRELLAA
jgi:DnaK suppressor protein